MLQIHESLCILLLPPSPISDFPKISTFPSPLTSHMMGACECKTFNCSYKLFKWKFYIWESLTNIANIGFLLQLEANFTCDALPLLIQSKNYSTLWVKSIKTAATNQEAQDQIQIKLFLKCVKAEKWQ